jgi:DNA modification methylase
MLDILHCGPAADVLSEFEDASVDLVVASPPYWTAIAYNSGAPEVGYRRYLSDMLEVFTECARVLRPNGKLCINAPVMPIPQSVIKQETRHLKNTAFDLDHEILKHTRLRRFSVFIWQKQTSKLMFGSYPYPGNLLENNTIELICVFVKPGAPPKFSLAQKSASAIIRSEWIDLTQQVWFMYPEAVARRDGHPAPFPAKLPARLIKLYSHVGEVVLDPFVGTGTTCAVAKAMGRRYIGIDLESAYLALARDKIRHATVPTLLVGRAHYPTKSELAGTTGRKAERKHKRKSYGRSAGRATE